MHSLRYPFVLRVIPALTALLTILAAANLARADEPQKVFGEQGEVALDDIFTVNIGASRIGNTLVPMLSRGMVRDYGGIVGYAYDDFSRFPGQIGGSVSRLEEVWFNPSVDVFVAHGLSIGVNFTAMYESGMRQVKYRFDDGDAILIASRGWGFTVLPRVGYAIPLSESFTVWPRLALGYSLGYLDVVGENWGERYGGISSTCMAIVDVGLVARVHRNVYLRAAPQLSVDLQTPVGRCGIPARLEHVFVAAGMTAGVGLLFGS